MRVNLTPIGNSQGVRIPKYVIKECNLEGELELFVKNKEVIIRPVSIKKSREGWEEAFKQMAENKDDGLLIDDTIENEWDKSEWTW